MLYILYMCFWYVKIPYLQFTPLFSHITGTVVACPPLVAPANGGVTQSGALPGATATYTCNPAYRLVGNDTRVCDLNGIWTDSVPVCARKCLLVLL